MFFGACPLKRGGGGTYVQRNEFSSLTKIVKILATNKGAME
jgi:hypothetical protein